MPLASRGRELVRRQAGDEADAAPLTRRLRDIGLCVGAHAQRPVGPFWTPILGPFWTPIDSDSFWMARTRVLEMHSDEWVRLYGKNAANQAVRGLHMLAPNEVLDRETKRKQRDRRVAQCRADLATLDPTRNTRLNRLWLSWFGVRLY